MAINDTIPFICSACGHTATFPGTQDGKAIYCPQCQAAQVVKAVSDVERIPTGRIAKAETAPATDRISRQPFGAPNRIDFTCSACNHASRISATLAGQPVRCPTCGTVQLAGIGGLRVVRLDGAGKLPFTCSACAYQARLSADYAGKAIRCPKCQAAQVVPRVLRDQSGTYTALPPGTGSVRKPLPSVRTPAGGTPVATPMAMPTPLPGSLEAESRPPSRAPTAEQLRTPQPMAAPDPARSGPLLARQVAEPPPPAPAEELFDAESPKPQPRSGGGVVRRSGRLEVQRTPLPAAPEPPPTAPDLGAEPTLEPARAVDVVADGHATEIRRRPAPRAGTPWKAVGLGLGVVLVLVLAVVFAVLHASANTRAEELTGKLANAQAATVKVQAELEAARRSIEELTAVRQLIEGERDALRKDLSAARKDLDATRAELEKAKETAKEVKEAKETKPTEKPKSASPVAAPPAPAK